MIDEDEELITAVGGSDALELRGINELIRDNEAKIRILKVRAQQLRGRLQSRRRYNAPVDPFPPQAA